MVTSDSRPPSTTVSFSGLPAMPELPTTFEARLAAYALSAEEVRERSRICRRDGELERDLRYVWERASGSIVEALTEYWSERADGSRASERERRAIAEHARRYWGESLTLAFDEKRILAVAAAG